MPGGGAECVRISPDALARLYRLIRCTACAGELLPGTGELTCGECGRCYPLRYGVVPSFIAPSDSLSPTERIELSNLERQLEDFYSADWRVGYNPQRVALIESELPDGVILDLGAADGQIAAHLTTSRRLVIGMEKSSRWIEKHRKLSVPFVIGDVYRIPFAEKSFDGAIMGELLEHLYDPAEALAGTVRTLVPGGVLLGTVPNFYFITKRFRYLSGRFGEGDDPLAHAHIRLFSRAVLRDLLERSGLCDIRITGILHKDLGTFPGHALWARLQAAAANLAPELLAVTFFFRARKR